MNIDFLKRELKDKKIEWGINPIYLIAIREQNPDVWADFVRMINAIDDYSLDKLLDKRRKDAKAKAKPPY